MSLSDDILLAIALVLSEEENKKKINTKTKRKRLWMKQLQHNRHRQNLLNAPICSALDDFKNVLSINYLFDDLLQLIGPLIKKQNTTMREAIPTEQRLSIALNYLTTGQSFQDLEATSAVSAQSIGKIVMECCEAIINSLKDYIKIPKTPAEWTLVADGFYNNWNFPNCLGAVHGKHIAIKKPNHSGSFYYNHKQFFSVVLIAVVNSNYEFLMVDVGVNGSISDGEALHHTPFGGVFYGNDLNLPKPSTLPNSELILPHVLVGNDAFQLTEHLLKPFTHIGLSTEQNIFNYRLRRAERVVENVFGILSDRFRVLQKTMEISPEKVQKVVLACCYLHNFLRKNNSENYIPRGSIDAEDVKAGTLNNGTWRQSFELAGLRSTTVRNSSSSAKTVRQQFCEYFNNEGQVPWQHKMINF